MSWVEVAPKRYVVEASELEGAGQPVNRRPLCPARCGRQVELSTRLRDSEGELVAWVGTCACGAEAHVLND